MYNRIANNEDLEFGHNNELFVKEMLNDMYADTEYRVEFNKWKFSSFDYKVLDKNNKIVHQYELKSRRISSNQYPTLMFSESKLNYAMKQYKKYGGRFTFLWYCVKDNKILEWEWNPNVKDYINGVGQNKVRHEPEKKCIHVSTDLMTEIVYE
jgi:hypothetical protein